MTKEKTAEKLVLKNGETIFTEFRCMDEFELVLIYKGKELKFQIRLMNYGTSYKLEVETEETKVLFEPDEERNWRAILSYEDSLTQKNMDRELLELIANELSMILK